MKKKVLYGIFMALFAVVSMASLQSCKDDFEDFKLKTEYNEGYLGDLLKTLQGDLNNAKKNLKTSIDSLAASDATKITAAEALTIVKNEIAAQKLQEQITALQDLLKGAEGDILGKDQVEAIVEAQLASVIAQVETIQTDLSALQGTVGGLNTTVTNLGTDVSNLKTQLSGLTTKLDGKADTTEINRLDLEVAELWSRYYANKKSIDSIAGAIANFLTQDQIEQLGYLDEEAVNKLIQDAIDKLDIPAPGLDEDAIKGIVDGVLEGKDYVTTDDIKDFLTKDKLEELIGKKLSDLVDINDVNTAISDALDNYYDKEEVDSLLQEIKDDLEENYYDKGDLDEYLEWINNNKQNMLDLLEKVATLETSVSDLTNKIDDYIEENDLWKEELAEQLTKFAKDEDLQNLITRFNTELEQINNKFNEITGAIEILKDRANKQITGIIVQGTFNPLFGTFSLPLGVRSNMLFNWYGYNEVETYDFPTADGVSAYDGRDPELTQADLKMLKPELFTLKEGEYLTDGFLGRVYLTLNPADKDLSGSGFSIETSGGKVLPYTLSGVKKSNETLNFGYSRGGDGFYEGDVRMPATREAVMATKVDVSGLKSAAKDLINDRSKRSALNMLKAVYQELGNALPAYGLRASWEDMAGKHSVFGQYEMAIATARPLSYAFYEGHGSLTDRRLPHIGNLAHILDDLINKEDFNFEFDPFDLPNLELEYTPMEFKFDITYQADSLTAKIPQIIIYQTNDKGEYVDRDNQVIVPQSDVSKRVIVGSSSSDLEATVSAADMESFTKELLDAVKEAVNGEYDPATGKYKGGLTGEINDQIKEKVIEDLQNQVNTKLIAKVKEQVDKLTGTINDQLADMVDKINDEIQNKAGSILNRVDKFIDIYNRVADKINNIIADPNAYLQPAFFYTHSKGVGIVSTSPKSPTLFKKAGGNAICLYASSYSAEILAPAYKKYAAIVNVYDAKGKKITRTADIENHIMAINNESQMLNKVLPGGQKRVPIATSKMKSEYTYEIVYQGVDYEARTSTQKFYIKISDK